MQRAAWSLAALLLAAVPAFGSADLTIDPFSFVFFDSARPAEPLQAMLIVSNVGFEDAINATARIELPPGTIVNELLPTLGGFVCEADGDVIACTAATLQPGSNITYLDLTLPASTADSVVNFRITVGADNEAGPYPNERVAAAGVYRVHDVTSTADSGAGTLRAEIEDANATCQNFCEIGFALPDNAVIEPLTPLPALTTCATLHITGARGFLLPGVARPVALSGAKVGSGAGITISSQCEPIRQTIHTISGLAIGGFPASAVDVHAKRTSVQIIDCFLGTDRSSKFARPNQRGVLVDVDAGFVGISDSLIVRNLRDGVDVVSGSLSLSSNRIQSNRGNGVLLRSGTDAFTVGNSISRNGQAGYAVAPGAKVGWLHSDSIANNGGLAIDQGIDGPTPAGAGYPSAPVIIAALYDRHANVTRVRGTVDTEALPDGFVEISLFSNSGYDANGRAGAEHDEAFLNPVAILHPAEVMHSWSFEIAGDLRGRILTAVAGTSPFGNLVRNLSEVSEGVPVR